MIQTLIIGAGMAGLACARQLHQAGHRVVVLDKGRGVGGRMATRRVSSEGDELRFDHGAQYFTRRDPDFSALLDELPDASATWADGASHPHLVGVPGMSGLPRAMAEGLEVLVKQRVTAIERQRHQWRVTTESESMIAERVVITVPVPQIGPLIGEDHALLAELAPVQMAPCWTLMAAFPNTRGTALVHHKPGADGLNGNMLDSNELESHVLESIVRDSSKPERPSHVTTWVAQASPEWSHAHLEADKAHIMESLLPRLCEAIGHSPASVLHVDAHRWRYARVTRALGCPFLRDTTSSLYLGGDWCLGARVEAAWTSGNAIAEAILEHS